MSDQQVVHVPFGGVVDVRDGLPEVINLSADDAWEGDVLRRVLSGFELCISNALPDSRLTRLQTIRLLLGLGCRLLIGERYADQFRLVEAEMVGGVAEGQIRLRRTFDPNMTFFSDERIRVQIRQVPGLSWDPRGLIAVKIDGVLLVRA